MGIESGTNSLIDRLGNAASSLTKPSLMDGFLIDIVGTNTSCIRSISEK